MQTKKEKYKWIKNIIQKYSKVELDEIIEDETEIEIDLFPSEFDENTYYKTDNSEYIKECQQIVQEIKQTSDYKINYCIDTQNSWQNIYIIKR